MNAPLIDINKAIQASYDALACSLPESIRPILLNELERLVSIAQSEQAAKDHARRLEDASYNGWKNRETWLVGLWWSECPIEEICADNEVMAIDELASQLEDYYHELEDTLRHGLQADLLSGAENAIDWHEIAEHWIDDIQVTLSEPEPETENA
jgi:hypothetical protein